MSLRRLGIAVALSFSLGCETPPARVVVPTARPTVAPPAASTPDPLDDPLPLDARITKGTLENGLTYYILPHKKPERRALLWLTVNAGSVLEDDDQRGIAHFVEHMAFNGTKHYEKQKLVMFLEHAGVRFGADLNAHTSYDETTYTLTVPTDDEKTLDGSLLVLRDWADGVTFDKDEVDQERGVVLEEWRRGRGARARLYDKQAPVFFHGSKYEKRIPIGLPETIRTVPRDVLVRFYQDWYRPDLMAVIAVGDFDAADIEKRIKDRFSSIAAPKSPRPRPVVELPKHEEPLVTIETDPEQTTTSVMLMSKLPHRSERSTRDYRRSLMEMLLSRMLNARLEELRQQPDPPFLVAGSSISGLLRTADVFRQAATVREDGVERGYGALLEELLRVERHGFQKGELERAKQSVLRNFQQSVKEYDKRDGTELAQEIVRNFLEQEAMPGRAAELALAEKLIPDITLSDVHDLAKTLGAGSRVIAVTGPATIARPSADALRTLDKTVAARTIAPYVDTIPTAPLMASAPTPGAVKKTSTLAEIGVTEWTLDNGARVVVKPTDFANDEVQISAFAPGGTSLATAADVTSAEFADDAAKQGGLGPYDALMLRKSLTGKVATVAPYIHELEQGLTGRASPADLETLFQMVNLTFTAPRKDKAAFETWRAREIERLKNRKLSPDLVFSDEMLTFIGQGHPRRRPVTAEVMASIDYEKAFDFYRQRFAAASGFTFVIVGNVDLPALKTLVEKYIGSLPASKSKETWRDVKAERPRGVKTKTVVKGTEPRSYVNLTFHGKEPYSPEAEGDVAFAANIVGMRLRRVLREDMGGVYGVEITSNLYRRPRSEYRITVSFNCAPENVDKLVKTVFDEIKALKDKGPVEGSAQILQETKRRTFEVSVKDNGFWLRELAHAYAYGDDPKRILDVKSRLEKMTDARAKTVVGKYVNEKEYVLGILKPQP